MTPREIAEKIMAEAHNLSATDWADRLNRVESILSEALADARESVNMECLKCRRSCAYYCRECYQGEIDARGRVFQENVAKFPQELKAARAEAYEFAAKICEEDASDLESSRHGSHFAELIRLRAGEIK